MLLEISKLGVFEQHVGPHIFIEVTAKARDQVWMLKPLANLRFPPRFLNLLFIEIFPQVVIWLIKLRLVIKALDRNRLIVNLAMQYSA